MIDKAKEHMHQIDKEMAQIHKNAQTVQRRLKPTSLAGSLVI
jgi:hypothetical protein